MQTRYALTGMALGSALLVGGATIDARAAEPARSATVSAERKPVGYFRTQAECEAAGQARGVPYTCAFWLYPTPLWVLYTD
ncbi:hypothetical protein AB0F18_07985 [Streptomyces sp. NPDC029216]|uniref:hypothetical protein n=1 Tax=Streptomyces sp. NPDC029216 TaxID=3154701 RepID=UPI0033F60F79